MTSNSEPWHGQTTTVPSSSPPESGHSWWVHVSVERDPAAGDPPEADGATADLDPAESAVGPAVVPSDPVPEAAFGTAHLAIDRPTCSTWSTNASTSASLVRKLTTHGRM